MNFVLFVLFLVIEIACAMMMRTIAKKRGANATLWFVIGLLTAPIAFLFIPLIKEKKTI